ncbi:MAG: ribonuclease E/G, partial [Methyloversatilis sp.]|nr:ribonuclease E/G [Methyloversatilis sp.]
PREPREPRAPRERAANDAREQQQVDLPLGADSTQPENGVPTEGADGAAPRSRRRRGGRRERGERRPEGAEGVAIGDVAAVEGDIEGVTAAANEAPVDLTDAQAPLALAAAEPLEEAPVFVPAAEQVTPVDIVARAEPVAAVIEETPAHVEAPAHIQAPEHVDAPEQVEVPAPAVMSVAEADAVEQISPEPVQAAPVIDIPVVVDVPVVRSAPPVTDSAESTLVRAMESIGSPPIQAAPAPVAAPADLQSSLDASGLVMVETQPGSNADQAAIEPEPVLLGRRRRQAPVIASEPMQQVETRGE